MITGTVNARRHAEIDIELRGHAGRKTAITAVIDTGFDGALTISPEIADKLQLEIRETRT